MKDAIIFWSALGIGMLAAAVLRGAARSHWQHPDKPFPIKKEVRIVLWSLVVLSVLVAVFRLRSVAQNL